MSILYSNTPTHAIDLSVWMDAWMSVQTVTRRSTRRRSRIVAKRGGPVELTFGRWRRTVELDLPATARNETFGGLKCSAPEFVCSIGRVCKCHVGSPATCTTCHPLVYSRVQDAPAAVRGLTGRLFMGASVRTYITCIGHGRRVFIAEVASFSMHE